MKTFAFVALSVAAFGLPASAQSSRSVEVRVADGEFEATVDGVVHRFDSAEALDAFLRARGLGSARYEKRAGDAGALPGLPGGVPPAGGPGILGKGRPLQGLGNDRAPRSIRIERDGEEWVIELDLEIHRAVSIEALDSFLRARGLGSASADGIVLVPTALAGGSR